ncbi:outer membrane beta-barrel protein [Niabella yanshanensis]|uniref:Outer membrane beta-barrel protein n=1 Tax=Niabella yanshanensis TaxID=577386 RepID=A0ABZ0W7M2_9BACT|nr:outer membrane beta-barrel protein [Niabella yanshanensis]WQD39186.1 outer membrane beta-barrel protein [Niabella yanshanensis]
MPKKYKHMTDEELDQLFRDAAESFKNSNPPEGAWEAFYTKNEQQLKNKEPESVPDFDKRLSPFFTLPQAYKVAAALLVLFAACTIVWLVVSKPGKHEAGTITQNISNPGTDTAVSVAKDAQKDTAGISTPLSLKDQDQFSTVQKSAVITGNKPGPIMYPSFKDESNAPLHAGANPLIPPAFPAQKDKAIANNTQQANAKKIDLTREQQGYSDKNNYTANPLFAAAKEPSKRSSSGRWQLGLVGGANIAMVKGDVSTTPGLTTGILVQHRINDTRVSVESGVIYENMTYAVENEYFNPGGKPVSSKVSNISGACTMIDVPVNVRYDMVHSKKRKAFVSTGVSPTVMVKQSYVYDYTDENGARLIDRDVTGQGKNFYAVANVSVGYEQKWNKTSVQVAPYLKIPMGEIGYGNLSLGGIGTQVSIKRDL